MSANDPCVKEVPLFTSKRQEIQQAPLSFLKDPRLSLFKKICKSVNNRRRTSCFTLLMGKSYFLTNILLTVNKTIYER